MWKLASDGWKSYLEERLATLQEERNRSLNTPKTANIDELFDEAVGLEGVSDAWYWSGMSKKRAKEKLDEYVSLRGDIAHRGAVDGVQRDKVEDFLGHVERLVGKTDVKINEFVSGVCGSAIY